MNHKKLFFICLLIISIFSIGTTQRVNAALKDLSGWAWSSNIGWLSFNSSNAGSGGGSYSVQVDDATGALSGFAWSSNIGWVKFAGDGSHASPRIYFENKSTPDPTIPGGNVTINKGSVTGWARACAGTIGGKCLDGSRTDGWDGWIKLSDTSNYITPDSSGNRGVTYVPVSKLKGYAWGSKVVGWLKFDSGIGGGSNDVTIVGGDKFSASCASYSTTDSSISPNVLFPAGSIENGSGSYSYIPAILNLRDGIYDYNVKITDLKVALNTVDIKCQITRLVPSSLTMWIGSVGKATNEENHTLKIKLGEGADIHWRTVNGSLDNCVGYLDKRLAIDIESSPYRIPKIETKGLHTFEVHCMDLSNNKLVKAKAFDNTEFLKILVGESRIGEQ